MYDPLIWEPVMDLSSIASRCASPEASNDGIKSPESLGKWYCIRPFVRQSKILCVDGEMGGKEGKGDAENPHGRYRSRDAFPQRSLLASSRDKNVWRGESETAMSLSGTKSR